MVRFFFNGANEFNVKTRTNQYVIISVVTVKGVVFFDNLCDQTVDFFVKDYFLCYVNRCEGLELLIFHLLCVALN